MVTVAHLAGLLTAVCWGLSPVVAKRGISYGASATFVATAFISTGVVVLWGAMAVTGGLAGLFPSLSPFGYAVFLAGGLFGTALGRIFNFAGVDRVGASVNSAVLSVNPLFATVLAFFLLGELLSVPQAAGIVVVVVGLAILSTSRGGDREGWRKRDLLFSAGAAAAFGAGAVIRRFGLTTTPATALEGAALNETAAFVGIVCYLLARRRPVVESLPPVGYLSILGGGLLSTTGLLSLFVGLQNGRVAIVTTLAGLATLFATLFTYLLLGDLERITRRVVVGAVIVVAGTSLITFF